MSILTVENVTHGFGARQILDNASFRLLNGEHVGLVGTNGAGKSTFLNIITGTIMPDEGNISWCNRITTGYLDQHTKLEPDKTILDVLRGAFQPMFDLEAEMLEMYEKIADSDDEEVERLMNETADISGILESSGFYTIDVQIEKISNGLGLNDIGLDRKISELSGGQRTKVLLTKLLLENPMILILDEPTNYLDENHIYWLKTYLQNYENAFILVSHDEEFMNEVINVVYNIENAVLTRYTGDYNRFKEMHELKKRQVQQAYESQQKEIAGLEDFIARNKARVATTNMAKSRQKKLDKMEKIEIAKEAIKPTFGFTEAKTTGRYVIKAENLVLGYDEPLTKPMKLELERGQKVAIRGVNGLGKSTLLNTLLQVIPPISGEVEHDQFIDVGYFKQEEIDGDKTAQEEIHDEFPSMTIGNVRSVLARCGLTREHIDSKVRVLSGGENAKVRLCKIMNRPMNLLVLDEPTNHLDVIAKDELKRAIKEFKGTVLLVSHEPEFYNDVCTHIWDLEQWTTKIV